MRWTKTDLIRKENESFTYQEELSIDASTFDKSFGLMDLKNVTVEGKANYDSQNECLMLDLFITGTMVLPCARTLEPVDYKFESHDSIIYSFVESEKDDIIVVRNNVIDTQEFVRECIMCSIPIRVVKEGSKPITSKSDDEVDPRFAKLKNLFKH